VRRTARVPLLALVLVGAISVAGAGGASTEVSQFGKSVPGAAFGKPGAGFKFGSRYTLPQSGTLVDFKFYAAGGPAGERFIPLIYGTDASGNPANLIVQGAEVTVEANQPTGWVSAPLPAVNLAAGQYVLALLSGATGGNASIYFDPVPSTGWFNKNPYPIPSSSWGDLKVEAQELSFYVDYLSDSTNVAQFGKTTVSAAAAAPGANYKFGSKYTLGEAGTLVDFNFYAAGGVADQKFIPVVYGIDGGTAGNLLAQGAEVTVAAGQPAGWVSSPLPAAVLPPGSYLLGLLSGPTTRQASISFDNVPGAGWFNQNKYPAPSSTWGPTSTEGHEYSYYVDYVPAGGVPPPVNTSPPAVSGAAQLGQTLVASPGGWTGSPSFAYQWQSCDSAGDGCFDIDGATSGSLTLAAADLGTRVRVNVTATGDGGSESAGSAPTALVIDADDLAAFGQATPGAASASTGKGFKFGTIFPLGQAGTLVDLTFYAAGGAAGQEFVPVVYSVGGSGEPDALLAQGSPVTVAAGQAAGWVVAPLPQVSLPAGSYLLGLLSGPNSRGALIYLDHVAGSGWFNRDNYPVPGPLFGPSSRSDERLSLHADYKPGELPANGTPPSVGGVPIVAQTLTASPGDWQPATGNAFAFQWLRCSPGSADCARVAAATAASYTPTAADVGKALRVRVTATNGTGAGSATSPLTAPVVAGLPSSIAALGDSISVAWGSSGAPGGPNPATSWSTGTDPGVTSHYQRLLALNPAIAGHAFNHAAPGTKIAATYNQAASAIAEGAEYVTLLSGTNDVCTPTAAEMTGVGAFRNRLARTLTRLNAELPGAWIFVASIPDWYGLWNAFHTDSAAPTAWATYGPCPSLLGAGATDADRQAVAQRIDAFNAVAAQVCASFQRCSTDGGAVHGLSFATGDLAFDYFHFSVAGQARLAAATWDAGPFAGASG
jgi:lysophospholipase L1-like esterase